MKKLFLFILLSPYTFAYADRLGSLNPNSQVALTTQTSAGAVPGGFNTDVQFSSNSTFGGDNGFQYDSSVSSLTVKGSLGTRGQIDISSATSPAIAYHHKLYGYASGGGGITSVSRDYSIVNPFSVGHGIYSIGASTFSLETSTALPGTRIDFDIDTTSSEIAYYVDGTLIRDETGDSTAFYNKTYFFNELNDGNNSPGTSGQVLTSNGAGTYPTWQAATGGSGSGSSVYAATSTASFPFGSSFSTMTVTQTQTGLVNAAVITSTGTGIPLLIVPQGFVSGGLQNQKGVLTIGDNINTRPFSSYIVIVDSTTDAQAGGGMIELWSNSPGHNDPKIWFHVTGHDSSPEIRDDANAPNWEMVNLSTNNTQGLGKFEPAAVAYQGVDLQRNSRSQDNGTFQNVELMHPLQNGGGIELAAALNNDGNTFGIDTAPLQFDTTNSHVVGLTGPMAPTAGWTFALPRTPNNLGQVLYQSDNGRGGPQNARSWDFTSDGSTGQVLTYQSGAAPIWTTVGGSGASALEVFSNFDGTRSSPTASIAIGDSLKLSITGSTAAIDVDLSSVTAHEIHNQGTLQTGATFYVSSGTVNGQFTAVASSANVTPIISRGIASQTGNLLEFRNSAGTLLSSFDSSGRFGYGTAPSYAIDLLTGSTNGERISGSSPSGTTFMMANSSSNVNWSISAVGAVPVGGLSGVTTGSLNFNNGVMYMTLAGSGLSVGLKSPSGTLHVQSGSVGTKVSIFQGTALQTGNLSEWWDSTGVALSSVTAAGVITGPHRAIGHTIAWFRTNAPLSAATGEQYYCDDCTSSAVAVSTGSAAGSWGTFSAKTTFPN